MPVFISPIVRAYKVEAYNSYTMVMDVYKKVFFIILLLHLIFNKKRKVPGVIFNDATSKFFSSFSFPKLTSLRMTPSKNNQYTSHCMHKKLTKNMVWDDSLILHSHSNDSSARVVQKKHVFNSCCNYK